MKTILLLTLIFLLQSSGYAADWVQRATFPGGGRHRGVGISIGTKGYIGLGHFNGSGNEIIYKDWWQYDPATNSWMQKADYIGNYGDGDYGAISFGTETLGFVGNGAESLDDLFYAYDPSINSWYQVSDFLDSADDVEGFVIGDKAYYAIDDEYYEYNTLQDTWTSKGTMPFDLEYWNAAFVLNNKGYLKSSFELWEYDPAVDVWTQKSDFPGEVDDVAIGFTKNGMGIIATGWSLFTSASAEVWAYDPTIDAWHMLSDFDGASRRFGCGFNIGDKAYLGIGTNGTNFSDFWELVSLVELDEQPKLLDFTVSPNPGNGLFDISLHNSSEPCALKVMDLTGKVVFESVLENDFSRVDLTHVMNGVYYFQLSNERGTLAEKVMVNK